MLVPHLPPSHAGVMTGSPWLAIIATALIAVLTGTATIGRCCGRTVARTSAATPAVHNPAVRTMRNTIACRPFLRILPQPVITMVAMLVAVFCEPRRLVADFHLTLMLRVIMEGTSSALRMIISQPVDSIIPWSPTILAMICSSIRTAMIILCPLVDRPILHLPA